jgi:hypothetical protein
VSIKKDRSESVREVVRLPVVVPREKISYSEWQLFRSNCQWRWHLEYAEGHKIPDQSIALEFGTAMHESIEDLLNPSLDKRVSVDEAVLLFRERLLVANEMLTEKKFASYGPWMEDKPSDSPFYLADQGEKLLRAISSVPEFKDSKVVKIEMEIDDVLERDDSPIRYRGFIDILVALKDKRGKLIFIVGDFKTCKWGWPWQKKEDENVLAQVRLYKHYLCKKIGVDPKLVRTYYFLLKKAPGKKDTQLIESFRVSSSERDIQMTLNEIQSDITKMRAGVYEKNGDSCSKPWGMCPHYDTERCPGKIEDK